VWVLAVIGVVALGVVSWVAHHVLWEKLRRDHVARVRALPKPRVTVAEVRRRCRVDSLRACRLRAAWSAPPTRPRCPVPPPGVRHEHNRPPLSVALSWIRVGEPTW
jgi:transposase InsO family protein